MVEEPASFGPISAATTDNELTSDFFEELRDRKRFVLFLVMLFSLAGLVASRLGRYSPFTASMVVGISALNATAAVLLPRRGWSCWLWSAAAVIWGTAYPVECGAFLQTFCLCCVAATLRWLHFRLVFPDLEDCTTSVPIQFTVRQAFLIITVICLFLAAVRWIPEATRVLSEIYIAKFVLFWIVSLVFIFSRVSWSTRITIVCVNVALCSLLYQMVLERVPLSTVEIAFTLSQISDIVCLWILRLTGLRMMQVNTPVSGRGDHIPSSPFDEPISADAKP